MKEEETKENNDNFIKLTLNDIAFLVDVNSPGRKSFDKIQALSSVSGKIQYWVYKIWKNLLTHMKDIETIKFELIKKFCTKDENGEPITRESKENKSVLLYTFTDENKILFNKAFLEFTETEETIPIHKITINSDLLEKMNARAKIEESLTGTDMVNLEKIFDFVE